MTIRWYGLVAPEEAPTGDRRMFAANALSYRDFPLPMGWQRVSGQGHAGAVVVASWDRQYMGSGGVWGAGEFLDPSRVPEVLEAVYLLEKRLIGPSVDLDPDLAYEVIPHPTQADEFAMKVTRANVHGVTLVMSPAFPQVHITVDDDAEMALLASAGISCAVMRSETFQVNSTSWRNFPLAPRETKFNFETAENNIAAWSGGDPRKYGSAFLWKEDGGNPLNRETYRLPIIDVIDGKAYLIPRAVFSAGVIMSGGHGGLYDTIDENQRTKVQEVLTDIYDMLREEYADPRLVAPWQRGGRQDATSAASLIPWNRYTSAPSAVSESTPGQSSALNVSKSSAPSVESPEATVRETPTASTVDGTYTSAGQPTPPTEKRCEPADGQPMSTNLSTSGTSAGVPGSNPPMDSLSNNMSTCLHHKVGDVPSVEGEMPKTLPLTTSTELAVCEVCCAQIATEGSASSQTDLTDFGTQPTTLMASGMVKPPDYMFANPALAGPTPLRVDEDGHVYGHLATWKQCHMGVGNRCVIAPHSKTNYGYFKQGSVLTKGGKLVRVGKITIGTGHADERFGVIPAVEHYDNTGACVAVVNAGEDSFGVWVAGALVADVDEVQAAELRRSPLSGDWRRVNGHLELVAALAVNSPGFPVLHEDNDGAYSLTAAGLLTEHDSGVVEGVGIAGSEVVPVGQRDFTEVDAFLAGVAGDARAAGITQAFHDLLPEEGCGCGV